MRASWDEYFMGMAVYVATRSKDRSTKIGAVLVGPNKEVRSTGYNGFARKVNDDVDSRHERPTKYFFMEHAERNAIYNAARVGTMTEGCVLYVAGRPPCADCARAIIQAGIKEVVVEALEHKSRPEIDWESNTAAAMEMLKEAGVTVRLWPKKPTPSDSEVVWIEPPDCPRCGRPLEAIKHDYGEWTCHNHKGDGKCLWYNWELTTILRARLRRKTKTRKKVKRGQA